jgi:RNA polymerase sigma-B factor
VPTISGEVKRHFRDHQWLVRPPRALQELQQQVAEHRRALSQTHGRIVSDNEVADALGIDPARVRAASVSRHAYHAAPADALLEHPSTDAGYDRVLERATISRLCAQLEPRDARLTWLRFVEGRTQDSIAAELGVSQMQVSRLLSALMRRLRSLMDEDQLAS